MSDSSSSTVVVQCAAPGSKSFQELLWTRIRLRKSLDEICHSLELELPVSERGKIHKHDKVEIRVQNKFVADSSGRRRVSSLLVDEVTNSSDDKQNRLLVMARSPARDIIDSTWSESILGQQTLEDIANKIAQKFGLSVTRLPTTSPPTKPVFSFSWESESPWTKLLSEADNQGYIFTSNEAGNLYLWQVASWVRDEGFFLTEGQTVRKYDISENGAEQYHEYIVNGGGKTVSQIDETCKGNRTLTLNLTELLVSEEALRRRAVTEMRRRKENKTIVTVSGWGLTDNQIRALGQTVKREVFWNPNFLIPVTIPSAGLSGTMLISEVECIADAQSMICNITLVAREVYT